MTPAAEHSSTAAHVGRGETLTEQVIAHVRTSVRSGELVPGELYSVYQLATLLGVSRSPVREALLRLSEAGLFRFERNRGFRILLPQPQDIAEIFAIRIALEVPAAARVAGAVTPALLRDLDTRLRDMRRAGRDRDEVTFARHDQVLHDLILVSSGNQRAASIVQRLRETTRILGASTAQRGRSLRQIESEHRPIVAAIRSGSPSQAAQTMREHLENTGRLLLAQAIEDQSTDRDVSEIWQHVVADR